MLIIYFLYREKHMGNESKPPLDKSILHAELFSKIYLLAKKIAQMNRQTEFEKSFTQNSLNQNLTFMKQ